MASFDPSFIDHELFRKGPVVIFVWKNEEGWPVEAVTQNLADIYGWDPSSYTTGALKYSDQVHPDDLQRVGGEVADASSNAQCSSFDHKPYRYLDGQGNYRWVKDSTRIIRDEEGQVTHYIGYLVDITNEVSLKAETIFLKERLDLAWKATNDGLWDWIVDRDEVYFSDRWKEMIGYDPAEFPNESKAFFDRVHPDDSERMKQALEYHFADPERHPYEVDIRLRCKDGRYKWIQARGKTSLNPDGTPHRMVGAHTDISERKLSEQKLQESLRRFDTLVNNQTDLVARFDSEGRYTFVNRAVTEAYGKPREYFLGKTVCEIGDTPLNRRLMEGVKEAFVNGRPSALEAIFPSGGASHVFDVRHIPEFDSEGRVISVLGIARDITERIEAERQMSLLTYSLDALSETVLLMEGNTPRFIYVNDGACRKLGYTKKELTGGMGVFDIDPDWNQEVWDEFWPKLEARRVMHFESRHQTKDGRIFPVEITSNYFEYDDRIYNLVICRDITERKRARERVDSVSDR